MNYNILKLFFFFFLKLVKPLDQNEQILQPARKALAGPAASDMQRPRRAAFGDITNVIMSFFHLFVT